MSRPKGFRLPLAKDHGKLPPFIQRKDKNGNNLYIHDLVILKDEDVQNSVKFKIITFLENIAIGVENNRLQIEAPCSMLEKIGGTYIYDKKSFRRFE